MYSVTVAAEGEKEITFIFIISSFHTPLTLSYFTLSFRKQARAGHTFVNFAQKSERSEKWTYLLFFKDYFSVLTSIFFFLHKSVIRDGSSSKISSSDKFEFRKFGPNCPIVWIFQN